KPTYFGSESLYRKWMHHGDIQYGDIVFTMEAPLGNVAKINDNHRYILSQRTIALRCKSFCRNDYFYYFLLSEMFQKYLSLYTSGTTAKGIQRKQLFKLWVLLPTSTTEQDNIANQLSKIDLKIQSEQDYLTKLLNIKQGLMQDLLTHKVPVDALL
ncbi:MAG: restriction endonuclease subunit S, partial [Eubacteriales bacterium]|nr:restriction endonuclease subunit S [Eubacteriales bacterium]